MTKPKEKKDSAIVKQAKKATVKRKKTEARNGLIELNRRLGALFGFGTD